MKSLDRQSLEDQVRLVSRYVAGDLSRSERAEFEAWLVASPELAAEVEMERRLRRGIASAARRGWLKRSLGKRSVQAHRWRMGLAASVVVAVTAVAFNLLSPRPADDTRAPVADTRAPAPLVLRTVRLMAIRSLGSTPDVIVPRAEVSALVLEPEVVVLTCTDGSIELECADGSSPRTPQYDEYELDLVNRRSAELAWRSARQIPAGGTQLSFRLREPARVQPGDYDMVVRGHSPDHEEVVARFWLKVTEHPVP